MFVCPTKLIPKSDTAHSGIKAGLSLFYGAISYFQAAAAAIIIRTHRDQLSHQIVYTVGRGLKTKSWNIKTRIAELGVFMHKFAIENDPKP